MKRLLLACLCTLSAQGQDIEFTFQIHEMEPAIARALEDRLLTGGETATIAMGKLPDFVREGRVKELESLSLTAPAGERTIGKSGEATLSVPTGDKTLGLEMEVDALVANGRVDLTFYAAYTSRDKDQPVERTAVTRTNGVIGIPMLLCRWQSGDQWLHLTGTANLAGANLAGANLAGANVAGANVAGGAAPPPMADEVFFVESAFYSSGSDAKFGREALASTKIPCRSGQRCRSEIIGWIDDENILEDDQPGLRSRLDPVLEGDGSLSLRVDSTYIVEAGGRTRLDSGERVRRLAIRRVNESLSLEEGQPAGRRAELARLDEIETEEDDHVAAFVFTRPAPEP